MKFIAKLTLVLRVVNFGISRHIITLRVFGGSFFGVFIAAFFGLTFGWFTLTGLDIFLLHNRSLTALSVVGFGCLNWVA